MQKPKHNSACLLTIFKVHRSSLAVKRTAVKRKWKKGDSWKATAATGFLICLDILFFGSINCKYLWWIQPVSSNQNVSISGLDQSLNSGQYSQPLAYNAFNPQTNTAPVYGFSPPQSSQLQGYVKGALPRAAFGAPLPQKDYVAPTEPPYGLLLHQQHYGYLLYQQHYIAPSPQLYHSFPLQTVYSTPMFQQNYCIPPISQMPQQYAVVSGLFYCLSYYFLFLFILLIYIVAGHQGTRPLPVPLGWQESAGPDGRRFYFNHNDHTTHYWNSPLYY